MIIDTDVLIWYFRGDENARAAIGKAIPFSVSAITVMELLQGAKNKTEQRAINKQLREWNVKVIHIDETISIRAMQYVSDFARSHGVLALDALIAGTVIENGDELITGNAKHFGCIPGLSLIKFDRINI
jgi:predicted nucleic acid-binding protein